MGDPIRHGFIVILPDLWFLKTRDPPSCKIRLMSRIFQSHKNKKNFLAMRTNGLTSTQ